MAVVCFNDCSVYLNKFISTRDKRTCLHLHQKHISVHLEDYKQNMTFKRLYCQTRYVVLEGVLFSVTSIFRSPHIVCRKALSFTAERFCRDTALGSRAEDGHQMYSGRSVVHCRWSFINWPRDLAHPVTLCVRGHLILSYIAFSLPRFI